jgi:1-acyl-sn-glycerol-3-phosphate acyltransferase
MSSRSQFFERYKENLDKYGFDVTAYKGVEPFVRLLFQRWFEVKIVDIEHIPAKGSAVLFGNHSGGLPVDGLLLYDGIINQHPNPRRVRYLMTKLLLKAPIVGKGLQAFGCVPPDYEITTELLNGQDLVVIYPEAEKGTGKLFKDRYKLVDFHAGFVRAALETKSPLVPIVTIGGEEVYPILANIKSLAKLLKWPYYPLTPFFPWLPFPFFSMPLPAKILMCVWPQFKLKYPPEAANDEDLVAEIASDIRSDIQSKVDDLLALRTSPFSSWNMNAVNAYLKSSRSVFNVSARHRL